MAEFFSSYGLWIFLGGIFVVMHLFGMGCCGGHAHEPEPRRRDDGDASKTAVAPGEGNTTDSVKPVPERCH